MAGPAVWCSVLAPGDYSASLGVDMGQRPSAARMEMAVEVSDWGAAVAAAIVDRTGRHRLPIGSEDFEKVVSRRVYVGKTFLIRDLQIGRAHV